MALPISPDRTTEKGFCVVFIKIGSRQLPACNILLKSFILESVNLFSKHYQVFYFIPLQLFSIL